MITQFPHASFRKPRSGYPESITTVGARHALIVIMDSGLADFVLAPE